MNDTDATLVPLFAARDSGDDGEAFVAAVRQRIAGRRRFAKVVRLALGAATIVTAGVLLALVPEARQYPVHLVSDLLASPLGAIAGVLAAGGLTWWARFVDA